MVTSPESWWKVALPRRAYRQQGYGNDAGELRRGNGRVARRPSPSCASPAHALRRPKYPRSFSPSSLSLCHNGSVTNRPMRYGQRNEVAAIGRRPNNNVCNSKIHRRSPTRRRQLSSEEVTSTAMHLLLCCQVRETLNVDHSRALRKFNSHYAFGQARRHACSKVSPAAWVPSACSEHPGCECPRVLQSLRPEDKACTTTVDAETELRRWVLAPHITA